MQLPLEKKALFLCRSQTFSEKKQRVLSRSVAASCEFSQRLVKNIQCLCARKCGNANLNGHLLLSSRLTKLYTTTISTYVFAMTHFFKLW